MVTTCKIKTEATTNVVDDKNDTVLCAKLSYFLPEASVGEVVVEEVTVVVGLSDKSRNLALVFLKNLLEALDIIPTCINVLKIFYLSNMSKDSVANYEVGCDHLTVIVTTSYF